MKVERERTTDRNLLSRMGNPHQNLLVPWDNFAHDELLFCVLRSGRRFPLRPMERNRKHGIRLFGYSNASEHGKKTGKLGQVR